MDRKLIEYLPDYMRKYREMQVIVYSEQEKFEELYEKIFNVLDNNFIMDADEEGISRYEKILGIFPQAKDTLENRRVRVQSAFLDHQSHTMGTLNNYLSIILGKYGYKAKLYNKEYVLEIGVADNNLKHLSVIETYLNKNIPANLIVRIKNQINEHSELKRFRHSELKRWTHKNLKGEVLEWQKIQQSII